MRRILVAVLLVAVAGTAGVFWWRAKEASPTASSPRNGAAAPGRPSDANRGAATESANLPGTPGTPADADPPGLLRLEGQVIDAEERPVAGATVGLSSTPRRTVRTEADGSFVFTALVPRTYTLAAMRGDDLGGPQTVRLTGHTEPVILRLATAGAVEVTVTAASDRKPVAGATVMLRDALAASGTTAADGKATLHPVARGRHFLDTTAPGFAPAMTLVAASGHGGDVQRVVVELQRGGGASGTVVDDTGRPVADAEIRAVTLGAARFGGRAAQTATSDGDGRWSFAALPAGSFRFAGTAAKHGPGTSENLVLDGHTAKSGIVVKLEAGAHVAGRVVKRDGTPVASATVRVGEAGRRGPPAGGSPGEPPRQTYTDASGHFDLDGLARRPSQLVALGETSSSENVPLDLAAQPEQTNLNVVLDVDGQIAGIVVDGKGQVVSGAQVTALPAFGRRGGGGGGGANAGNGPPAGGPGAARLRGLVQDITDGAGHFVLSGLPEGSYRLRASRDGATPFDDAFRGAPGVTAAVGEIDVKLTLEDTGRVRGKVLFTDGSAPSSFTVSTGGMGLSFGGGGGFEVDAPAGPVTVSVSGSEFLRRRCPACRSPPTPPPTSARSACRRAAASPASSSAPTERRCRARPSSPGRRSSRTARTSAGPAGTARSPAAPARSRRPAATTAAISSAPCRPGACSSPPTIRPPAARRSSACPPATATSRWIPRCSRSARSAGG